jgi:hypothetical protein
MTSVLFANEPVKTPNMKDVLVLPIIGAVLLPGLVIGDALKQYYTKRKMCTEDRYIFMFKCTEWPAKGETF